MTMGGDDNESMQQMMTAATTRARVANAMVMAMKYALVGERIGDWCSILKARSRKE
jgi:hypothetical protein